MENNPEYFSEIVYLRAFAILAVISLHVVSYFTSMSSINFLTLIYMSIGTFSYVGVPLFVCISGFVLYNKYKSPFSLKLFYKKRFKSVLPQYIIFSILAILSTYVLYIYSGRAWNFGVIDIFYMYLSGENLGHLWFFMMIIQLYILYPVLEKIFIKFVENHKILALLIFLLVIQILYQAFLVGKAPLFLGYIFYFVLGMYVRSQYLNYKNKVMTQKQLYILFLPLIAVTIFGIAHDCKTYFGYDLFPQLIYMYNMIYAIVTPFYDIIIITLFLSFALKFSEIIPDNITNYLRIIGNYSFGIYLIHGFIVYALASILFPKLGFDINNWLFYPITFFLVLNLSLVCVHLISKFPYHEYIIGTLR